MAKWKTYLYYFAGILLLLFIILNWEWVEPKFFFITLPKLPLGVWLMVTFAGGFLMGRGLSPRRKIKVE